MASETNTRLFTSNLDVLKNFKVGDNVIFQCFGGEVNFGFVERFAFNSTGELILGVNVAQPLTGPSAVNDPGPKIVFIHPGNRVVNITRGQSF